MPKLSDPSASSVYLSLEGESLQNLALHLRGRGLRIEESPDAPECRVTARALSSSPSLSDVEALVAITDRDREHPLLMLLPPLSDNPAAQDEELLARAQLVAHGVLALEDPDVWLESIVLLALHAPIHADKLAILAPKGSYLSRTAMCLERERKRSGQRLPERHEEIAKIGARVAFLVDPMLKNEVPTPHRALVVAPPGGSAPDMPVLSGLRPSWEALRLYLSLTAPRTLPEPFDIDRERIDRQLGKVDIDIGDHECKVLLSSAGIAITRQAVATTPSAATRIAKKAGYPVDIKAWGPGQPSEVEGCAMMSAIDSAAEVRRAFSLVMSEGNCEAVIVREAPAKGRSIRIRMVRRGRGSFLILKQSDELEALARALPLCREDAVDMAECLSSTRQGEEDLDREALVDLLLRLSQLSTEVSELSRIQLERVIVGARGQGAVVVDARAERVPS